MKSGPRLIDMLRDLVGADFRIPPRRTANSCIANFAFWLRPYTLRKDLVASRKDLMTLRKDLMTVGKDRKTGFLREHLRVRDSHDYVRIGCVWKICDAFYGMLHIDELYLGWIYGV